MQLHHDGSNRNSSASHGSVAGSDGSRGDNGNVPAIEADPEWAPHVDLGKQLATLHALLVDSLPKLPPGRMQVIICQHRIRNMSRLKYSADALRFPGFVYLQDEDTQRKKHFSH